MARQPADTFRKSVARILHERGMTMTELALLIGTKRANISRILSGGEGVTLNRAGRIAKALHVELSDLISTKYEKLQQIS